jgi:hypothetical protein
MRGGFGGGATPPTGGLGGRTPQKLGLSDKIGSNAKSVEYRLHIRRGTHAKGEINNQFLITGFRIRIFSGLAVSTLASGLPTAFVNFSRLNFMFSHLIIIKPLGMMYGSSGAFLSPENLVAAILILKSNK